MKCTQGLWGEALHDDSSGKSVYHNCVTNQGSKGLGRWMEGIDPLRAEFDFDVEPQRIGDRLNDCIEGGLGDGLARRIREAGVQQRTAIACTDHRGGHFKEGIGTRRPDQQTVGTDAKSRP